MWELRAHGQSRSKAIKTKDTSKAVPTVTHMMFVKLVEESLLKAVISQNCDGLHRRSGLTTEGETTPNVTFIWQVKRDIPERAYFGFYPE